MPSGIRDFSLGRIVSIALRSSVASWPSLSRRMTTFLSCSTITPERMRPSVTATIDRRILRESRRWG